MADVAVLPPQNILPPHNHRHRHHRHHKQRNPPHPRPVQARTQARPASPPLSGPIRILKRGEDLPVALIQPKPEAPPEPSTSVGEPAPIKVVDEPKPVMRVDGSDLVTRVDWFYAGSGFVTSPPPSSVPMPAFFTARKGNSGGVTPADDIASGLRRLLNLE